jgi:glyoxylase-like metal-dependent hydrolase (beta-lactamase superfamily II)
MSEQPSQVDLGGVRVTLLSGGALQLDGGAMFGIIPRPLWERSARADDRHRIQLACNCLLVEWEHETDRRAIIETGHGEKLGAKEREIFAIDTEQWLLPNLVRRAVDVTQITDVILTHLHFDHAGGLTHFAGGACAASFPSARVHVSQTEFDDARAAYGVMTATYREENFAAIDADAWRLGPAQGELLPGIRALATPGHTRGHRSIRITGRDRTLVFVGDVMPTAAHYGAPYNMAYDLFPMTNRESKRDLLNCAVDEDWLLVLGHEPVTPFVRAVRDSAWFRLEPGVCAP